MARTHASLGGIEEHLAGIFGELNSESMDLVDVDSFILGGEGRMSHSGRLNRSAEDSVGLAAVAGGSRDSEDEYS